MNHASYEYLVYDKRCGPQTPKVQPVLMELKSKSIIKAKVSLYRSKIRFISAQASR